MLSLATPVQIQNLTRMKVTAATPPDLDVADFMPVTVAVLGPPAGQTDQVQLAKAYSTQVLRIRNGACDSISFSADVAVNPYNGLIVRGQITSATLLDTCVSAMVAAGGNLRNQYKALETALAAAGVLPAGSVA